MQPIKGIPIKAAVDVLTDALSPIKRNNLSLEIPYVLVKIN